MNLGMVALGVLAAWLAGSFASPAHPRARSGPPPPQALVALVSGVTARIHRARRAGVRRQRAAEFVLALADELRSGLPLPIALTRAAEIHPVCPRAKESALRGGDIADLLRRDAEQEGLPVLGSLATLWVVAAHSGSGLAAACTQLGHAAVANEQARRDLRTSLTGPRTTMRVLAVLPVVGLGLGTLLGAQPVAWLLGSPLGLSIVAAGTVLDIAGVIWLRRMVRGVEQLL